MVYFFYEKGHCSQTNLPVFWRNYNTETRTITSLRYQDDHNVIHNQLEIYGFSIFNETWIHHFSSAYQPVKIVQSALNPNNLCSSWNVSKSITGIACTWSFIHLKLK